MQKIVIESRQKYLTQEFFNAGAGVYVVKGDYFINSQIILPAGSELRIEEGSIAIQNPSGFDSTSYQNGIFLFCSGQQKQNDDIQPYSTLCLTSKSEIAKTNDESSGKKPMTYRQTDSVFMKAGDYIKNPEPDNFEMKLTANCRILLPESTNSANLHVSSDKVNTIQIDGKCNFQLFAEDCKLERIFACEDGMVLVHRIDDSMVSTDDPNDPILYPAIDNGYSQFDNCEIFAEDFNFGQASADAGFLSIWFEVSHIVIDKSNDEYIDSINQKIKTLGILNRIVLQDCIVSNIGFIGSVSADNCIFLFGPNVSNNTLQCLDNSRITNCIFNGQERIIGTPNLTHDVINISNVHDIIVEGCTFKAFSSVGEAGVCMITVMSHYTTNVQDQINNNIDPQNGIVIRNCFFDLPTFTGSAIEVWNSPKSQPNQDRSLNGQFTMIEGNYMEMPKASAFVNCFRYSDYVTVSNNVGCVNNELVLVNNKVPDPTRPDLSDENRPNNKVHNLVISGNILRYQKYKKEDVPKGMLILKGTYIKNLTLENNSVEGSLWSMWPQDIDGNLEGTVRVVNNESIGNVLFRARSTSNAVMPSDVLTFFSGNVSNGKKTDIGNTPMQLSEGDGLFFNGRTFFNTALQQEAIYLYGHWRYADYES